jgi:hypothetical protein
VRRKTPINVTSDIKSFVYSRIRSDKVSKNTVINISVNLIALNVCHIFRGKSIRTEHSHNSHAILLLFRESNTYISSRIFFLSESLTLFVSNAAC